jgi:hypothetical protein
MPKDREKVLEKFEATERLTGDVMAGKTVNCDICQGELEYHGLDPGRHPGIYCSTGCTEILMEVRRK